MSQFGGVPDVKFPWKNWKDVIMYVPLSSSFYERPKLVDVDSMQLWTVLLLRMWTDSRARICTLVEDFLAMLWKVVLKPVKYTERY